MTIHKINTITEFESFKDKWDNLVKGINFTKINSYFIWNYLLYKNLYDHNELFILIAEDEKGIAGIAPLIIQKRRKIFLSYKTACFIGNEYSDWNDFIIVRDNVEVIREFIRYIFKNGIDEILLNNINDSSKNLNVLKDIRKNYILYKIKTKCYYIKSNKTTWEDYLKNFTSKKFIQKDLRKLKRKFDNNRWEVLEVYKDLKKYFDVIIRLHNESQIRKNRRSLYVDKQFINFILEIMDEWEKNGMIRIFVLLLNNIQISYAIIFTDNNFYYGWQQGFDIDYSEFSPTKFLMSRIIMDAFEKKISEFHFMRGEDDYKSKWTKDYRENYQFRIYKKNLLNSLFLLKNKFYFTKKIK